MVRVNSFDMQREYNDNLNSTLCSQRTKLNRSIAAIIFFMFVITHSTASFPWNNTITYFSYAVYIVAMVLLFIASLKKGEINIITNKHTSLKNY